MRAAYETVMQMVEARDVNEQSDRILQQLGAEMRDPAAHRPALRTAVDFLVDRPQTDTTPVARFKRLTELCGLAGAEALDDKVRLFVDLFFDEMARWVRVRAPGPLARG